MSLVIFLNTIHEKGHSYDFVTGRVDYLSLKPPFLQVPVVFVHGSNNSISISFLFVKYHGKIIYARRGKRQLVVLF